MKQRQTYPNQPFPQAFRGQPWPLEPQGPRLDLNSGCGLRWLPSFFFQAPNGPKTPEKAMKYVGRENFSDVMKLWVVFLGDRGGLFTLKTWEDFLLHPILVKIPFPRACRVALGCSCKKISNFPPGSCTRVGVRCPSSPWRHKRLRPSQRTRTAARLRWEPLGDAGGGTKMERGGGENRRILKGTKDQGLGSAKFDTKMTSLMLRWLLFWMLHEKK